MFCSFEIIVAAVVAAEKDNGVFVEIQFFQQVEYLADLAINHADHRSVAPRGFGPVFILVISPCWVGVGNVKNPMRRRDGEVTEKGFVLIGANEFERFLKNNIVRILRAGATAFVSRQRYFFAIFDNVGRIITVGVDLVVITEEDIETVLLGHAGAAAPAAAPFTKASGGIAASFKHIGDGLFLRAQGRAAAIHAYGSVTAVLAGHQHATRGRAHRRTGERLREPHTLFRQTVNTRGAYGFAAHERGFKIAEFIAHNVNDVGLRGCV